MRRTIALVLFTAVVAPGVGCSSLKYEQRTPDGGVISFKATDRDAALSRIKQDYGDVVIEQEYDPTSAKPGRPFDPNAAVKPSERMATTGLGSLMGGGDEGKTHIKFAKKPTTGVTPPGLPPAPNDGGLMQAGYTTKGGADRKSGALPPPNMSGVGGPVQGIVDCGDGTCTTGK
jgi:hypothetical protein